MWKDEKIEYLRSNRDYSRLLDGDHAEAQKTHGQIRRTSKNGKSDELNDDVSVERQEYLDRRRRLKELERQKLTNGRNGVRSNGIPKKDESKTGSQNRGEGSGRRNDSLASAKDKKKLPYDRSFGSFFGPSEPVVAKRIIEEARAREEAEIVASRTAKPRQEVVERKTATSANKAQPSRHITSKAQVSRDNANNAVVSREITNKAKVSRDSGQPQRPPKPGDKDTERARKLKEARDYSFLFDESQPLSHPPAPSKQGGNVKSNLLSGDSIIARPQPKNSVGLRNSDRLATSPESLHKQVSSSRVSHYGQSSIPKMVKKSTSSQPAQTKASASGPGRPDRQNGAERKEAVVRKTAASSTKSNGNGNASLPSRPSLDKRVSQARAADLLQVKDRSQHIADRRSMQGPDRGRLDSGKRVLGQVASGQGTASVGKPLVQPSQRKATPVAHRQQSHSRPPILSPKLRRAESASEGYRPAAEASKLKQQISEPKPAQRVTSRLAQLERKPPRYSNGSRPDQTKHKRSRSMPEESDFLPRKKTRHQDLEDTSDDDKDSFIDDGDDMINVSKMIRSITGYNPDRYRGNDDFDDRMMEVGFHHIQMEERRSAREARLEDEKELALIEAEEKAERLRRVKKKQRQSR